MNIKRTSRLSSRSDRPVRGRADLARLKRVTEREIVATSPGELANLPAGFWEHAALVQPTPKKPISLRVDVDVLRWFKQDGPRYQSRMNAVLRAYMIGLAGGHRSGPSAKKRGRSGT